jgi:uncharacterized MAPEG superfamily protein
LQREKLKAGSQLLHRMDAAHSNALEAWSYFAVVSIIAHISEVPVDVRVHFALLFVFFRLFHVGFYYFNMGLLRSFVHLSGVYCLVALIAYSVGGQGLFDVYFDPIDLGIKILRGGNWFTSVKSIFRTEL